jgi:hypothetical protein
MRSLGFERQVSLLRLCTEELKRGGRDGEATTLVGIWEACYGGCDFVLSESESKRSAEISKYCFFSPDVPALLIRQVAGWVKDPTLREELRKMSFDVQREAN